MADEITQEQANRYMHGVGIAASSLTALYLNEEQPLHLRLHAVTVLQEMRAAVGGNLGRPDWESEFLHAAAATVIVEQEFPDHAPALRADGDPQTAVNGAKPGHKGERDA